MQVWDRRICALDPLEQKAETWTSANNAMPVPFNWLFTAADGRIKLSCLYSTLAIPRGRCSRGYYPLLSVTQGNRIVKGEIAGCSRPTH